MAGNERVLSVRLRAIIDGYEKAMQRAAAATDSVEAAGQRLERRGKTMMKAVTAPATAAAAFSVREAIKFESAWAGVLKTVDGSIGQLNALQRGVVEMGQEVPSPVEEIASIAEAAGQLGIAIPNILGFSKVMIDLGNATDVSAHDAAMSLAQLANITQMNQHDFDRLGSSIAVLGNDFATTESRIIDMSLRLASAGSQAGMSEAEILGFATALSSVGIEAEAGGSAVSRVMIKVAQSVAAGGAELEKWSQIAGMTSQAFGTLFRDDSARAMSEVVQGLGRVASSGQDLFGVMEQLGMTDIRVGNAMRSLAGSGDLLSRAIGMSTQAWDENIGLVREAEMRYSTTESRLAIAGNRMRDVARETGEAFLPLLHGALGLVGPLADGFTGLIQAVAAAPPALQGTIGGLMGMAVASGPVLWAFGKLQGLYAPVIDGLRKLGPLLNSASTSLAASRAALLGHAAAVRTAAITGQGMAGALSSMGAAAWSAVGPQVAIAAAIVGTAAVMYKARQAAKELEDRYMSSARAADILAESTGGLARQLRDAKAAADEIEVISEDDFRAANAAVIQMLRELDTEHAQTMLLSIGFEMISRGDRSPEEAIKEVERLAKSAGIEIPAGLTVEGASDFQVQLQMVEEAASRAQEHIESIAGSDVKITAGIELELSRVAESAASLFQMDETAAWLQLFGEGAQAAEGNASALNHLVDEMLKLSGVQGLSTSNAKDLASALDEMTGGSSAASAEQKEQINTIRAAAEAMEGGLTPANLALAASQYTAGVSAQELGQRVEKAKGAADGAAGGIDDYSDALAGAATAGEEFAAALESVSASVALSRLEWDAGAAAAQAFADALDHTTRLDNKMGAGLGLGGAFKRLNEGLTGSKASADAATQASDRLGSAVDRMSSRARRAGERLGGLEIRMQGLAAAGSAYRDSISSSTLWDDQIQSAMSLGDAFDAFRRTYRRLPVELDMVQLATGKLRKRQGEALQNVLSLGKAATDYLATLIEMGKTEGEVQAEAKRMRDEYHSMFTAMGMTTEQANKYVEAMGLLPSQVTTAIELSGVELARFQLQTYIDLLEGKIPDTLATEIIAMLDRGQIDQAAQRLADFARTNPAVIDVEVDSSKGENSLRKVKEELWELPKTLDPVKAALGGYTEAQQSALDAVMALGDGISTYLGAIAHEGNMGEVRDQAYQIRDAFMSQLAAFGIVGEEAQRYAELIGLTDWQIETAISVTGDAEAMFRIEMYAKLLGEEIPSDVATTVLTHLDAGDLDAAASELEAWRKRTENDAKIRLQIETHFQPMAQNWPNNPFQNPASYSTGGLVRGPGTSTSDSIPARLSDGEFVIRAASARRVGYDVLGRMNDTGTVPGTTIPFGSHGLNVPSPQVIVQPAATASDASSYSVHVGQIVAPSPERVPSEIVRSAKRKSFLEHGR